MGLHYIDEAPTGKSGHFVQYDTSRLVSSFLESKDPSPAIRQSFRIVDLLLLSNQVDHAYALACAIHKHVDAILPPEQSRLSSQSLELFCHTHPEYPRPENCRWQPCVEPDVEAGLALSQWHAYRECTRTGWMLEHCQLAEPDDPHIWRETDDPALIAMCARLLAKDKIPNQYPADDQLREALAASQKLYAQPQVPITEWTHDWRGNKTERRHSYLLYRRLVTEIAIRLGQLDTAADVLSQGLRLDGFNHSDGASLEKYLKLPGIYDVLPLLAEKGKQGNPYFIEDEDAGAIVQEITRTLESRAERGRQWSLAPEKVGWDELLDRLAKAAWVVNNKEYRQNGIECADDILHAPASEEDIKAAEDKVGELPQDLKEMLRVADGFKGGWHFLEGGIAGCQGIDFDQSGSAFDDFCGSTDAYLPDDVDDASVIWLDASVECDGFEHFILPPAVWCKMTPGSGEEVKEGEYQYWNHASWRCEIDPVVSIREWVADNVETLERRVEDGEIESDHEEQ